MIDEIGSAISEKLIARPRSESGYQFMNITANDGHTAPSARPIANRSSTVLGALLSAFFWGYVLSQRPGGMLANRHLWRGHVDVLPVGERTVWIRSISRPIRHRRPSAPRHRPISRLLRTFRAWRPPCDLAGRRSGSVTRVRPPWRAGHRPPAAPRR
ncbi:hypothetical protein ACWDKQ_21300 [Saccharopolyspora sp. NPDC000995]